MKLQLLWKNCPDFDIVHLIGRASIPPIDLLTERNLSNAAQYFADNAFAVDLIIYCYRHIASKGQEPGKDLRDLDPEWWLPIFRLNRTGHAPITKHFFADDGHR